MHPWRVAKAAGTGTSHSADSVPCQDSHLVDFVGDPGNVEFLLIAVADGAGSAKMSHEASKTACNAAISHLKFNPEALRDCGSMETCLRESFAIARQEIEDLAKREAIELRELATTLLVAAVGPEHAAFGQVGDGAVVWGDPGRLRLSVWPEQAALNLTDFLTSAPLEETLRLTVERSAVRRIACMTDGLAPILLDFKAKAPHAPIFERLFTTCQAAPDPSDLSEDLKRFLESDHVNDRTDDDKTLVLAVIEERRAE